MDDSDNPYEILGLEETTATAADIRSAYRKLALQHHPDKQRNESERQTATARFAKISNAYEVLSDPEQRQTYDRLKQQQQQQPTSSLHANFAATESLFHSFFHQAFHDPFQVFEQVFRDELFGSAGVPPPHMGVNTGGSIPSGIPSMFGGGDPFASMMAPFTGMSSGFFGGGGGLMMGGGGLLGTGLPSMGMGMGMGVAASSIGGGNMMMMQQQQGLPFAQQMSSSTLMGGGATSSSFYSSSSSHMMGGGGGGNEVVMTQTTTQNVNGVQQTVTERIVRQPDGTVQRFVTNDQNNRPSPSTVVGNNLPLLQSLPGPSITELLAEDEQANEVNAAGATSTGLPPTSTTSGRETIDNSSSTTTKEGQKTTGTFEAINKSTNEGVKEAPKKNANGKDAASEGDDSPSHSNNETVPQKRRLPDEKNDDDDDDCKTPEAESDNNTAKRRKTEDTSPPTADISS